jgi:hypothetical protein
MLNVISDPREIVEDAIEESKTSTTDPYVGILFYFTEEQSSFGTAQMFVKIRKENPPASIGKVFIVDIMESPELASRYGIVPTPALIVIWKGRPLVIRRPGWEDSTKVVGCLMSENWAEILRSMKAVPSTERKRFLSVNPP